MYLIPKGEQDLAEDANNEHNTIMLKYSEYEKMTRNSLSHIKL